jgi:zinc transport system ATP-binding protein
MSSSGQAGRLRAEAAHQVLGAAAAAPEREHMHGAARGCDHAQLNQGQVQPPGVRPTREVALDYSSPVLIRGRGLTVRRDGRDLLTGVDIDIRTGEIVTLIGPNGGGKTTLVRVLLQLMSADRGRVECRPGLVVGYVPQRFDRDRTLPMTVERFIRLGVPQASGAEIAAVLAEVGAAAVGRRQIVQLSGGELQRVVLARALLRRPDLLVLDEPVRGVDFVGEGELYDLVARLSAERRVGVLLVSHDLHVVMARSDRVICLNRHICCEGVPETVAQEPSYRDLFGGSAALAIYRHRHDHEHDLAGRPCPPRVPAAGAPPANS